MHKFLFRFIWNGRDIVEGLFFCILGSLPFVFSNLALCKVPLCPFKKQICVMCKRNHAY